MFTKFTQIAIVSAAVLLTFPQASQAKLSNVFKSSEFLTWDRQSQEFYIRTSVGMASLIVGQSNKAHRHCLEDWYYNDETVSNDHILSTMKQYSEYHPRGILLSILEKKCGRFIYGK